MRKWPWFILSLVVIAIDCFTKTLAVMHLIPLDEVPLAPILNLSLAYNSGAAFSFLSQTGPWHKWFFAIFSTTVSLILTIWILRLPSKARLQAAALSLILGGAVGNLIDRIRYGHVIDFIDFHYMHYHWPIFNIADAAITIGAFLLLIDLVQEARRH